MTTASRRPSTRRARAVRRFAHAATSAAVDAVACALGTALGTAVLALAHRWFAH
ncbi:hypothetical protein [Actinomadura rayongensis]|uniref:Uncharacterized protein n=1 Tax=Actinomadura rayongensis TaxID=1429076 RepID=A0A6I4WAL3_9ACTN|nr:hypothetical protein [Actinomadura rayongensis]MXQ66163.1 hypothetical protein [Actinomadura rayongensis]